MNWKSFSTPFYLALIVSVVALGVAIHAASVQSRQATREVVAFINFPLIMQESEVGKNIAAQLKPKQQVLQEDIQAKFNKLKQEQDELNKHRTALSKEEYEEKSKAMQQEVADWNAQVKKRQTDLNEAANAAMKEVQKVLHDQLVAVAEESNIVAILPVEQAFYAQSRLDLTPEAIRRLNAKLSNVELKFGANSENK